MQHSSVWGVGWWLTIAVAALAQPPRDKAQPPQAGVEALPPWQRVLLGDDAKRAEELTGRIADDAGAIEAAEELLDLRRRVQGADHWEAINAEWQVTAMRKLAELTPNDRAAWHTAAAGAAKALALYERGKYAEAAPLFRKALEIYRKVLGEEHPDTAASYSNVAINLADQGNYAEADPLYRTALEISRKMLGEEHPDTATTYDNIAFNLNAQAKHAEADPLFRSALEIRRHVLGEEHPATATSYNNVATNLGSQGKFAEAEPLLRKALETRRALLGEEHPATATSYNNVATNLDDQGKYAEAEPLLRKALETRRAVLGEEHRDTANSYNNLAFNLDAQEKHVAAEPLYRKALEIVRNVLGEEHPETASSYNNLAVNLDTQGKYAEAAPLLRKALEICQAVLGEEHPETARGYHNVAANLAAQGKYAEAEPLFRKTLKIVRNLLGEEHPHTATGYNNLAISLNAQGGYTEARQTLAAAVAAYEAARLRVSTRGLDRATFGSEQSPYSFLAALDARQGQVSDARQALESDLARGLLDEAASRGGAVLTPEEEAKRQMLLAELDHLQPRILELVTRPERSETEQGELDALLRERAEAETGLADLAVALSRREVATLDEVRAALPADGALLAWVDVRSAGGGVEEHWGCVLRASGPPAWARLPGTGPEGAWTEGDAALAGELRQALVRAAALADVRDLAARLAAQRMAPLAPYLKGVRRLYVAAVREMAGIPVEVLTDRFTVSYLPSGTQLARLKARERPTGEATLLALGDAVFDPAGRVAPTPTALPPGGLLITQVVPGGNAAQARLQTGDVLLAYAGTELISVAQLGQLIAAHAEDDSVAVTVWRETEDQPAERDIAPGKLGVALAREPAAEAISERRQTDQMLATTRGGEWHDLPGTRVELARLGRLFEARAVTLLADSDASEQRLEELRDSGQLARFRYLHLATHGEANEAKAFESALILAQDQLPTAEDIAAGARFYDGRLTANEVLETWKLDAELVTLSACESGLGRAGGGEGHLGFAQALLLAGSRSVCLSLWKVDDTATALLMDRFYQNVLGRRPGLSPAKPLPKAEALAEAKAWLRGLSQEEAGELSAELTGGVARGAGRKTLPLLPAVPEADAGAQDAKPYSYPTYWAAFVLIGDPE